MGTHNAKAQNDQTGERKRDPAWCKLDDDRGPSARAGLARSHVISEVLYLKQKEKQPPSSYLLPNQEPGLQVNTVFGNVPLGSCLSYQLQNFRKPKTKFIKKLPSECKWKNFKFDMQCFSRYANDRSKDRDS